MWFFIFLAAQFLLQYLISGVKETNDMFGRRILFIIICIHCSIIGFDESGMSYGIEWFLVMSLASTIFANIAGAILGHVVPGFSQRLTDKIREWYKRDLAFDKQNAQEHAETLATKKQVARERKATSPKAIRKLCAQGVGNVRIVARRNPDFWEPMMAFVRVLATKGKGAKSELDRLLARGVAIEEDIKRLKEEDRGQVISHGFQSNRRDNIAVLEKRLGNVNRLAALVVHQLNDLDDDMVVVEADIPTARDYATERRDSLIKELRTTLDAIELEIGVSNRRAQEQAIALADEEVAKLTSGELRAVQANDEINKLLERCGMEPIEPGDKVDIQRLRAVSRQRA